MRYLLILFFSTTLVASEKIFVYPFPMKEPFIESLIPIRECAPKPLTPKDYDALFLKNSHSLEKALSKVIFGQDRAVKSVSNAIMRYAAGISDPNYPIATMLFFGPSGVGKTELVHQLGYALYGEARNITCFNMSEFSEPHTISRLIGAPPGYVGYGTNGELGNVINKQPYSIILLDEVEKAHPQVLKFFLHLFDTGLFTTSVSKQINCRKCIFIMTSNLAALEIVRLYNDHFAYEEIVQVITPYLFAGLSPELFNRMESILFLPLPNHLIEPLVLKLLDTVKQRIYKTKKIVLIYDQTVVDFFTTNGIDPVLGARPLKRLIDKELTTLLAKTILEGNCKENDTLFCHYQNDCVVIEKR